MDLAVTTNWMRARNPMSVRLLTLLGAEHGVDPEKALQGTGLTPDHLNDPNTLVRGETEVQVVRNLLRALPHVEDLGLQAGLRYYTTLHGPLGQAYAASANGWAAFELVERYAALTWGMLTSRTELHGEWGHIYPSAGTLPPDVQDFYQQRDNGQLIGISSEIGMQLTLDGRVPNQWRQAAPRDPDVIRRWTEIWGDEPVFGAPENIIKVELAALLQPLPKANPLALPGLLAECDRLNEQVLSLDQVSSKVRMFLLTDLVQHSSLQEAADHLHVSPRTLRRQLSAEGSTFREILEAVRYEVAVDLLTSSDLPVTKVSSRLGYENAPAFTHAFRRWAQQSPSEFREAQRVGSSA